MPPSPGGKGRVAPEPVRGNGGGQYISPPAASAVPASAPVRKSLLKTRSSFVGVNVDYKPPVATGKRLSFLDEAGGILVTTSYYDKLYYSTVKVDNFPQDDDDYWCCSIS